MKTKKWVIKSLLILVVFLLLLSLAFGYLNWQKNYQGKIYPGIKINTLDLSGKTPAEAKNLLDEKVANLTNDGLHFQSGNKKITIESLQSSFDSDLAYPALFFDIDKTINQALTYSQTQTFGGYLLFRLKSKQQKMIKPVYTLNEDQIKQLLNEAFPELNISPVNAAFSLSQSNNELQISPEKLGKEINYDLLFSEIKTNLDNLDNLPITIKTKTKYPSVNSVDLNTITTEAKKILSHAELKLIFAEPGSNSTIINNWAIKPDKLLTWVSVNKSPTGLQLSLDQEKIKEYLSATVSPKIDLAAVQSRFEIKNGKVVSWQTGASGRQVDLEVSAAKINNDFLNNQTEIYLVIKEVTSISPESQADLNIKEIIGTGHSNFAGSSVSRRKNIRVGADAVHGILLTPGEEFSLVRVLGDVSAETGYVPELVIKGNKTIPEYGGGLCQIGTTVFRSALASGLPITERRNHSYRVSYYEPAGMDAAIYIPNPDVRFVNDTTNYILIQARIVKDDIYFDFWGTKDGRTATTTTPIIYNIVKPAPTKYIETEDLPAGQKKCTERAHNGADAYFDYTVVYPENSTSTPIQERRFSSHYVPWQEVCLIGKSASSSPEVATSTQPISPSTSEPNINPSSTVATSTQI
jgi:vancomycin resistance protein YoaR